MNTPDRPDHEDQDRLDGDDLTSKLNDLLDGRMSEPEAEELRARIASDAALGQRMRELEMVVGGLRGMAHDRAPVGFADRVMASVDEAAAPSPRSNVLRLVRMSSAIAASLAAVVLVGFLLREQLGGTLLAPAGGSVEGVAHGPAGNDVAPAAEVVDPPEAFGYEPGLTSGEVAREQAKNARGESGDVESRDKGRDAEKHDFGQADEQGEDAAVGRLNKSGDVGGKSLQDDVPSEGRSAGAADDAGAATPATAAGAMKNELDRSADRVETELEAVEAEEAEEAEEVEEEADDSDLESRAVLGDDSLRQKKRKSKDVPSPRTRDDERPPPSAVADEKKAGVVEQRKEFETADEAPSGSVDTWAYDEVEELLGLLARLGSEPPGSLADGAENAGRTPKLAELRELATKQEIGSSGHSAAASDDDELAAEDGGEESQALAGARFSMRRLRPSEVGASARAEVSSGSAPPWAALLAGVDHRAISPDALSANAPAESRDALRGWFAVERPGVRVIELDVAALGKLEENVATAGWRMEDIAPAPARASAAASEPDEGWLDRFEEQAKVTKPAEPAAPAVPVVPVVPAVKDEESSESAPEAEGEGLDGAASGGLRYKVVGGAAPDASPAGRIILILVRPPR